MLTKYSAWTVQRDTFPSSLSRCLLASLKKRVDSLLSQGVSTESANDEVNCGYYTSALLHIDAEHAYCTDGTNCVDKNRRAVFCGRWVCGSHVGYECLWIHHRTEVGLL